MTEEILSTSVSVLVAARLVVVIVTLPPLEPERPHSEVPLATMNFCAEEKLAVTLVRLIVASVLVIKKNGTFSY